MPLIHLPNSARSSRAIWHKELRASNVGEQLDKGNLTEFPKTLLSLTKEYVGKKKLLANTHECDQHLHDLVDDHVRREKGSREAAILACLMEYSPFTARTTLLTLRGDNEANPSYTTYLRCLIVAHTIVPAYVSEKEAHIAMHLLQIRSGCHDPLSVFRSMIDTLATVVTSQMLPVTYINRLLTFCQIPQSYDIYLRTLYSQTQLASLHQSVSWMADFMPPRQCELAFQVLTAQVPQLHLWTAWKPDEALLGQFQECNFVADHLSNMRSLVLLEGPDTTGSGLATLKDAAPECFQLLGMQAQDSLLITRLQRLLCNAASLGQSALNLLGSCCVEKPATESSLSLVENIVSIQSDECCKASLSLLTSFSGEASIHSRVASLASALPVLERHASLREHFSATVVDNISGTMDLAQKTYREQIKINLKDGLGYKIQDLGTAIRKASWVHDRLTPEFLEGLAKFPPDELLASVMDRVHASASVKGTSEKVFENYLSATLCGGATSEDIASLRAAVERELEFWITHHELERNRTLIAIQNLPYMTNVEFLHASRAQILVEDIVFLRDLVGLIERDTHLSCVDMLRVLGRRLEIPINVHVIWTMLVFYMLEQKAADIVEWTCENLSMQSWFRWLDDVQLVLSDVLGQHIMAKIGFTDERLRWWAELKGPSLQGVEYIDRLQRKQAGELPSLKWLYLQEVPETMTLLDVVTERQKLGFNFEWVLLFLEPKPDRITVLCKFLASYNKATAHCRHGIRALLTAYHSEAEWPDSAAEVHLMTWLHSTKMTKEDQTVIRLLADLMHLSPSINPKGISHVKSRMVKEYNDVIERACKVEGLRLQLEWENPQRTMALANRLGMKGIRPFSDQAIPESLSDAVECVGRNEYELCFPLTHIQGHDRKARGIGSDLFPLLTVRVCLDGATSNHGFCLHMVTHEAGVDQVRQAGDEGKQHKHDYWRPAQQKNRKPASRLCTTNFNLFTHALAQRLHRHFNGAVKAVTLQSVYDLVMETIRRPGCECTACGTRLANLWKPTICGKSECVVEMSRSNLLVRAYGLLVDAAVLDFLLCCVYAAALDGTGLQLLPPDAPFGKAKMLSVIDTFPALILDDKATPMDLLNTIRANSHMAAEREQLLAWMSKVFRGCMLSAPPGKRLLMLSNTTQFLMYNSTPECEKAFERSNKPNSPGPTTGNVVFHGSASARMWKVLTEGLRNMSNTKYMAHGAANGPGIYLADEPSTSFGYSGTFKTTWKNTAFSGQKILLGCELLDAPKPSSRSVPIGTHIVTDESRVLVRYIFVCPTHLPLPLARQIAPGMRTTYASLRSGTA